MNRRPDRGSSKPEPEKRVLANNRKARHDYHVIDTIEAGIALQGTEVKSIRAGKVNLGDSYAVVEDGEAWLVQLHVSPYDPAHQFNHDPLRRRKLLLHRPQIRRLIGKVREKGLTLIPLAIVLVRGRVKIELGLCRGKRLYDKREATAKRDAQREMDRARREARR
jgi:SsrA-binding protein